MRIVGLIAEYNPFHNGHQYHIGKAKEIAQADVAIVVMSGNFVQRGTPAIMPKHLRTEAALTCGADLVIELPVCYATGSAEQFAYGAVSLLDKLGCVNAICFGSECGDIASLQELAFLLSNEPDEYKKELQNNLRSGMSFPLARQTALQKRYPDNNFSKILEQPNNILGVEYIKALYRLNSKIEPLTIQRIHSHYHDTQLQEQFSSASALRQIIANGQFADLSGQIPVGSMSFLVDNYQNRYPIFTDDFSLLLKYRLLNETKESLTEYADVSEELANRIYHQINNYVSFEDFCESLKTKEITYSRISRALLHILLNIKKTDYTDVSYAHILGFRIASSELLTKLKKYSAIPLITKLTSDSILSAPSKRMLDTDIYSANLYESVVTDKFKTPFINELQHSIVRV